MTRLRSEIRLLDIDERVLSVGEKARPTPLVRDRTRRGSIGNRIREIYQGPAGRGLGGGDIRLDRDGECAGNQQVIDPQRGYENI